MLLPLTRQRKFKLLSALLLTITPGCSAEIQDKIVEAAQRHRQAMPKLDEFLDQAPATRIEKRVASSEVVPSPGRQNPFEIASTYDSDSDASDQPIKKKEILILGFVELEKPMAILSIDGQSQTFAAGDTHDRITVTEVSPPRARITLDGVTWYASIFDPR